MPSENKLWLPPLSPKDQQRIDQHANERNSFNSFKRRVTLPGLASRVKHSGTGFNYWLLLPFLSPLLWERSGLLWHRAKRAIEPASSNTKRIFKSLPINNRKLHFRPILTGCRSCYSTIISEYLSQGMKYERLHERER